MIPEGQLCHPSSTGLPAALIFNSLVTKERAFLILGEVKTQQIDIIVHDGF